MSIELNHILEKTLNLFYKYGIRSVSMDDIASEMGISKKTLYHYFKDKTKLVEYIEQYHHDIKQQQYENIYRIKHNAIEEIMALHGILESFVLSYSKTFEHDLKKYYPDLYKSRYFERKENITEMIQNNLKKGIEEGVYRSDININILSNYKISFILFLAENETDNEINTDQQERFNEIFKLHLYGILTEKGIKEFEKKFKEIN